MKNSTRKVWVNPVPRTSAQGRDKQYYQTYDRNGMVVRTVNMKKVKEKDIGTTYMFPRSGETNKLHTGLNKTIPNPFKGMEVVDLINQYQVHPDWHEKLEDIILSSHITKQTYLEIKHGEAPHAYSSNSVYSMFNMPPTAKIKTDWDKGRGKLDSMEVVLYPRPNSFENSTPRQELIIAMIEALVEMDLIAASKDEANPSYHEFYISEDNEEETRHAKKLDFIESAYHRLYMLKNKNSYFKQYQFATVLTNKANQTLIKGESTPEMVKGALSAYVSDRNKDQMEHAQRLIDLYDLQETPDGADRFHIMYLVQQAINSHVILYREGEYIWPSQSATPDVYQLGNARDRVISFFLKEMNTPRPKDDQIIINYYDELLREVTAAGVRVVE